MPIEHFIWTEHAEQRLAERGLTRTNVESAIRDGHDLRRINTGDADWRVQGIRPDGRGFEVIYDHPVGKNHTAARIVSAWPLRRPRS